MSQRAYTSFYRSQCKLLWVIRPRCKSNPLGDRCLPARNETLSGVLVIVNLASGQFELRLYRERPRANLLLFCCPPFLTPPGSTQFVLERLPDYYATAPFLN
jgi:hypothetical protein